MQIKIKTETSGSSSEFNTRGSIPQKIIYMLYFEINVM